MLCFKPQHHHNFLLSSTTISPSFPAFPWRQERCREEAGTVGLLLLCALEGRGKPPLYKALISSRSQSTLQRRQSSCLFGRWAVNQEDAVSGSQSSGRAEPLAGGQGSACYWDLAAPRMENTVPGKAFPRMLISTHSAASILNVAPWIIWTKMPALVICNGFHLQCTRKNREQRNCFDTFKELNCRSAQPF